MRAVAQAADGATMLKQRTLALWVAQNRLAAAQLEPPWPAPGRRRGRCPAGRQQLCVAGNGHRNTQPGVPQDRSRRCRLRGAGLRARPSCGLSRAAAAAMKRHRAGFTLIELLIALGILGLVAVLGYRALAAAHRERGEARCGSRPLGSPRRSLRAARGRRARGAPARRSNRRWHGGRVGRRRRRRRRCTLRFSRAGPEFAAEPGSGGQRIGYRLHNGAVEVLYWPFLDQPDSGARSLRADRRRRGVPRRLSRRARHMARTLAGAGRARHPRAIRVELTLAGGEVIERWLALR